MGIIACKAEKHPIVWRLLCTKILFKVQRKLTVGLLLQLGAVAMAWKQETLYWTELGGIGRPGYTGENTMKKMFLAKRLKAGWGYAAR